MEKKKTNIHGLYILNNSEKKEDSRGVFRKPFNEKSFINLKLHSDFKECYYSISRKNVIRGMHFQIPPYEHEKLVFVPYGKVLDVVLDIRKNSKTYGNVFDIILSGENGKCLYVPKGCAHGFKSKENGTIVMYLQTTIYNKDFDCGIRYNSFGYDWKCNTPIISSRDKKLDEFAKFISPFGSNNK